MKKLSWMCWILLLLVVVVIKSCKKDDDVMIPVELELGMNMVNFNAVDLPRGISLKASYAWSARLVNENDSSWCKLKPAKDSLFIHVMPNPDTLVRFGRVHITTGNDKDRKEAFIDVIQKKAAKAAVVLSPAKLTFFAEEPEPARVEIISNVNPITWEWCGSEAVSWMLEPVLEGNVLTLNVKENPDFEERKAVLAVVCGNPGNQVVDTIHIEQLTNERYIRLVGQDTIHMDYLGNPVKAEVIFNVPVIDHSIADGFTVEVEKETRKYTFTISAKKNFSLEPKKAELYVNYYNDREWHPGFDPGRTEDISITESFAIYQHAAPKAEISTEKNTVKLSKAGTAITVGVNSSFGDWACKALESWCEVSKTVDGKLSVTATANSGGVRSSVVELSCGDASVENFAKATFIVVQAGNDPFIFLDKSTVTLADNGAEQIVYVQSDLKEWGVNYQAGQWYTITKNVSEGWIKISAQPLEGGQRSADIRVSAYTDGGQEISVPLKIVQMKGYQVGDLYKVDGQVRGIVFEVWDNGLHGRVLALKGNGVEASQHFSIDMYAYNFSPEGNWERFPTDATAVDKTDGRANMQAFKNHTFTDGKDWKYHYPAAAWVVEVFDQENGALGWYLPAYNEIVALCDFMNGSYQVPGTDPTPEQEEHRKKINDLIKENGGEPIIYDVDYVTVFGQNMKYLVCSTELSKDQSGLGFVGRYMIFMPYKTEYKVHAAGDISDPMDTGQIRPVLQF